MTEHITGALFKAMMLNGAAAIELHKAEVNELNVFPVPDGDTGTNMSLTLASGVKAFAADNPKSIDKAAELTANALLRGARGNSGVILSLLFRGISKCLRDVEEADAATFAAALKDGVEEAYRQVGKPVEGTILTVSRHAAHAAAERATRTADIEDVLEAALASGRAALDNTINVNPVLKKAGVIDSGGMGYIYILDGMLRALRGEVIESGAESGGAGTVFSAFTAEDIEFAYCTEFIIIRDNKRDANALRAFLDARGDSVVVVDDEALIKVHVHTNTPGLIITEALTFGALTSIKIDNLREQHTEMVIKEADRHAAPAAPAKAEKKYGMAAVCAGDGMAAVFRDLGADRIITGGQTMNPSTDDILAQIEQTPSEIVFVFPNNKNIVMAARQCVPLASKKTVVIPSASMPQGVTAMLAFDESMEEDENVSAMTDALKNVATVHITHAARDSVFDGQEIRAGQYLALFDDSLLAFGDLFGDTSFAVANKLIGRSPEFVTVFTGADATEDETRELKGHLTAELPGAELNFINGGQPVYRYIISAE